MRENDSVGVKSRLRPAIVAAGSFGSGGGDLSAFGSRDRIVVVYFAA